MASSAAHLSALTHEIEVLPRLVLRTLAHLPDSQKRKFEADLRPIFDRSIEAIKSNVTEFDDWKATAASNKTANEAKRGETSESKSRHLIHLLNLIEKNIRPNLESKIETKVTAIVQNCVASLWKQVDELSLEGKTDLRNDWRDLHHSIEALFRRLEISNAASEQDFIASLWWMFQQGESKDLNPLFEAGSQPRFQSNEAMQWLSESVQEIIKRAHKDLLTFFSLTPDQFTTVIEVTIERGKVHASSDLKALEQPTEVIQSLQEIKQVLQDSFKPSRIAKWLSTPSENFDGKSPRDKLLEGYTPQVSDVLTRSTVNLRQRELSRKFASLMLGLISVLVLVGFIPLGRTVLGFGMAFGGSLLAYECYLLLKASRWPSALRGLK